jgi:DNA-binding HxlR family transcriptional regulator
MAQRPDDVFYSDCPARSAIEIITSKWAVVVLHALSRGPMRHGELVERIGGISKKVLGQTLQSLQDNGLVRRERFRAAPPRVEYSLTPLGETLSEPIAALTRWARENGAALADIREARAAA